MNEIELLEKILRKNIDKISITCPICNGKVKLSPSEGENYGEGICIKCNAKIKLYLSHKILGRSATIYSMHGGPIEYTPYPQIIKTLIEKQLLENEIIGEKYILGIKITYPDIEKIKIKNKEKIYPYTETIITAEKFI